MTVISFLSLLVALVGVQALLVVKVADRMTGDARDGREVSRGRDFGIA